MKVVRLHGPGDLRLHEEPEPTPLEGEVKLRIQSVGICGSDLHWMHEGGIGDARLSRPLVLGHEFTARMEMGERVAVDPAISCGECEMCVAGNPNLCERLVFAGHGARDGAMCELMAWPVRDVHRLPDSMSFAEASLLEPLGIALHAVDLAKVKPGMTVGVYGCGPLGLLIVQVAKLAGASSVIATDLVALRIDAARGLGAETVLLANEGGEATEILAVTHNRGVDVAFEVAGTQPAVQTAFDTVAVGGKVMLVGIPANDRTAFSASIARRKGLTIKMVRRMKHAFPRAIKLVEAGRVDLRSLVTHRLPLERAPEAFGVAERREGLKVVLEVGEERS